MLYMFLFAIRGKTTGNCLSKLILSSLFPHKLSISSNYLPPLIIINYLFLNFLVFNVFEREESFQ